MRRQNHSCDQCRKAKRACDAPPLTNDRRASTQSQQASGESSSGASLYGESRGQEERVRPCSYCQKTKKHCTRYWARSQLRVSGSSSHAREDARPGRRLRLDQRATPQSDAAGYHAAGLPNFTQPSSHSQDVFHWDPTASSFAMITPPPSNSQISMPIAEEPSDGSSSQVGLQDLLDESYKDAEHSSAGPDGIFTALTDSNLHSNRLGHSDCSVPAFFQDHADASGFVGSSHRGPESLSVPSHNTVPLQPTANQSHQLYHPLSPASVEHTMIFRTNNTFISHNLLRVYHDVLEHNLSCWVSEVSCPYKMSARNRNDSLRTALSTQQRNHLRGGGVLQEELGSVWSNRIYFRVIKLDRVAQASNMIRLTRAEDQAAMKALHLVIMAFASQWAQQSRRERERYPATSGSPSQEFDHSEGLTEEFDRLIQRSLWEQARKALEDCAGLECYRVVCAELIFGLTQKPWEKDDPILAANSSSTPVGHEPGVRGMGTSLMARVQNIISKEGPPVFMERAARKAHALKFQFDAVDTGLIKTNKAPGGPHGLDPAAIISARDRETSGFVYWFAIMFDTISAAIHQRPVVVGDEDSQHSAAEEVIRAGAECGERSNTLQARRWSINHFIQDNLDGPGQQLRWPCSYAAAARAIARSGPVKILLYRHVSYLQDAIRRRQRGEPIEHIIRNSVLVYCYWNVTYGVFFRDLIENYDTVPPRIQSWFFCIHAHWHLAALILADLIESVDSNELGDSQARQERLSSSTVDTIRRSSARELSDLARITTPSDWAEGTGPPAPQLPEFHSAVNQGAILTEPWTMILIRAFSKAFIWHLGEAELWQRYRASMGHGPQDGQESINQCVDCVRALWYLGKKSDMARNVAVTLSKALTELEVQNIEIS